MGRQFGNKIYTKRKNFGFFFFFLLNNLLPSILHPPLYSRTKSCSNLFFHHHSIVFLWRNYPLFISPSHLSTNFPPYSSTPSYSSSLSYSTPKSYLFEAFLLFNVLLPMIVHECICVCRYLIFCCCLLSPNV